MMFWRNVLVPPIFTAPELVKVHAEVMWWKNMCRPSPRGHIIFTSPMGLYHEMGCFQNPRSLLGRCHPPPPPPLLTCDGPDFHKPYNWHTFVGSSFLVTRKYIPLQYWNT